MSDLRRIGLAHVVVSNRGADVLMMRVASDAGHVAVCQVESAGNRGMPQHVRRELATQNVSATALESALPPAHGQPLVIFLDAAEVHEQRGDPDAAELAALEPPMKGFDALGRKSFGALFAGSLAQDLDRLLG